MLELRPRKYMQLSI